MSPLPDPALPTVALVVAEAGRRRCEDLLRHETFAECVVMPVASLHEVRDLATCATLRLTDDASAETDADCDYALPTTCTQAELRTAVQLLAKIATLRGALSAARRTEDALQQLAATDPLTGLANRRTWDDELARQALQATACGEPLTLAIVDLDEFKRVNETYGHAVGDAVLRAAAEGLRRAVRRGDLAARIGGDEFGLLLPGLAGDAVLPVVERIRQAAVAAMSADGRPPITCSLGATTQRGGIVAESLYAAAAAALQTAKQAGRNRCAR